MSRILAALLAAFITITALPAMADTIGIVRGTVEVNGKPAAGVKVTLSGEGTVDQRKTDEGGTYIFSGVQFGSYTLTADYPGVAPRTVQLSVSSDQVLTVNMALGELKTIGSATVTAHAGVSGTPVSVNDVTKQQIAALPINNSLNQLVQTVPGVVRFSYNEPVAHGFHGVTYEMDGAPMPLATSSNFAEIIDPKNIDSLEIFTGAIPAEYGGNREGAVVNIISNRASDLTAPYEGYFTTGGGSFGQVVNSFDNAFKTGKTEIFLNANTQVGSRGLDTPTVTPIHDENSQSDEFLRTITTFNDRQSLAFDVSNQLAQFQIPMNTNPNDPTDPQFNVPATDDVQREYDRYASLNFTSSSKDGNGIFQLIPWVRSTRIAYDGDLQNDVLGLTNLGPCSGQSPAPSFCTSANPDAPVYQSAIGLKQDRKANYVGLRVSDFRATSHHAFKVGLDANREILTADETFACYDPTCNTVVPGYPLPPAASFTTNTTNQDQAGTQVGLYAQDKWTPSQQLSVDYGLRYDRSTGYVGGDQLSPRIGVNYAPDSTNVIHAYYGRFYAAPQLEDVRQACVVLQGCSGTPTYDLKPETDSYAEIGLSHTFSPRLSVYVNQWERYVSNVLDTTQLLNTPLFAVYNNAIGRARGTEVRMQAKLHKADTWFISGTWSNSLAAGISGSTFLFPPSQQTVPGVPLIDQLSPEDHSEAVAVNSAYTHRFGLNEAYYATIEGEYGTGFPVSFEGLVNGQPVGFSGTLPTHLTADLALGRDPGRNGDRSLGYDLSIQNLFNDRYIIKIANGFNTTQYSQGFNALFRVTAPL